MTLLLRGFHADRRPPENQARKLGRVGLLASDTMPSPRVLKSLSVRDAEVDVFAALAAATDSQI